MSQRAARKYREEMSPLLRNAADLAEEQRALRRKQLDRILSHQGKIDLDLDPETLAQLRSAQ